MRRGAQEIRKALGKKRGERKWEVEAGRKVQEGKEEKARYMLINR